MSYGKDDYNACGKPYYPDGKQGEKEKVEYHPDMNKVGDHEVENRLLPEVRNRRVEPHTIDEAIIKTPVVLAETQVQINVDSFIKFPEPVLEIKAIKKQLKLVQARLLLPTNKLFLRGFVRKNIQYAAPRYSSMKAISSDIRSLTVDVPFSAVTEIKDFINKPIFHKNPDTDNFTFFSSVKLPSGFSQKEKLLSGDFTQFDQISGEVFNELPFVELISSEIFEFDEFLDRTMGDAHDIFGKKMEVPFEEATFTKLEEKMVVDLTLKVLQKQQVRIKDHGKYYHKDDDKGYGKKY